MSLANAQGLWRPDLAAVALDPSVTPAPLRLPLLQADLYETQTRGTAWLYATPRSVLGDVTGLGKTLHIIALICALHATGELTGRKAIIVTEPGVVEQMAGELERFAPGLRTVWVSGQAMTRQRRRQLYQSSWDVLVCGYPTMWRDALLLTAESPHLVAYDESTNFANDETKTAQGARTLASVAARVHAITATPVMLGLQDFYSQLRVLGFAGYPGSLFGNEWEFTHRYLVAHHQTIQARGGRQVQTKHYSANPATVGEFRQRLSPYYLRRNTGSADMPTVMPPEDVWLDMTKAQGERYRRIATGAEATDMRFLRQLQAATTLANLGDEDHSAKFDWFMRALETKFVDDDGQPEKVVVYLKHLPAVEALRRRLAAAGWDAALITGAYRNERESERQRFWHDPACRVAIGTKAIEKGLNLQVSRWAVMLDLLFNPSRMEQFLGRVKRSGSLHPHVHLIRVMCRNTSEEGILQVVRDRQELADFIQQDESDLFRTIAAFDPAAAQAVLNFGQAA